MRFEKADVLRFQIVIFKNAVPKRFMSAIWFKIVLIVYEIAISNTPRHKSETGNVLGIHFNSGVYI